ncbi:hypothetical protein [Sphingomonas abietis]|uniref:Sulfur globule protein n=1 Tax=Sphingomonas abietis TaxID=3012344 RepID=A0ABY7NJJ7_9SPHN|nr:hypothetical protein [Sphingomonas abietis]WBO21155.1 hypothetical protein PBT88_13215 [Sphingomonas abietis]
MRLLALAAAATLVVAGISASPAAARPGYHHGHGHGWHHGQRRRVCRTVWLHHHRVRRCTWR